MIRKVTYIASLFLIASCGSSKSTTVTHVERRVTVPRNSDKVLSTNEEISLSNSTEVADAKSETSLKFADRIINTALEYSGVRYKYGGTSKAGLDCSGLMLVSFREHDFNLPRSSSQMAEEGRKVKLNDVEKGDLLFFCTGKRNRKINHVGLVVTTEGDEIKFIHSSSSRGVIVSSLREGYWNSAFVKANRVL
ncbi:C40 family peptidase [Flavobacteriaceae bacterium KMM 6897]|nr:C40 family peptidase [Flavobacteriaceae bacterium KMM 6897]MEB8346707.1 C40 family peptidase [Flavobacteriaceae bacterium KMM 6898]